MKKLARGKRSSLLCFAIGDEDRESYNVSTWLRRQWPGQVVQLGQRLQRHDQQRWQEHQVKLRLRNRYFILNSFSLLRQPVLHCRLCKCHLDHRDRTRARTLSCIFLFFSSFEHAKNLLIMGPNNTKTHQKVWFSHI